MELGELISGIDSEDHALLTVVALLAVHPDGLGLGDGEFSNGKPAGNRVGHRNTDRR